MQKEKRFSGRVKRTVFTKEMKKTHTILIPDMLPIHFRLIASILEKYGYKTELLQNTGRRVVDEGLKNVHNDTCYPALLVIGQFMDALNSGKYDLDRVALLISQTGGGCRASNYIHLLRKALSAKYPDIPVLSLNFSGLEKDTSLKLTLPIAMRMIFAVLYGDFLMSLYNQVKPYEVNPGDTDKVLDKWQDRLKEIFNGNGFVHTKKYYRLIATDFSAVKRVNEKKPKVGIVGEIYVKYSPLANNDLNRFLMEEGCEPNVPGLLDFVLYCTVNTINDAAVYDKRTIRTPVFKLAYRVLYKYQKQQIKFLKEFNNGEFMGPHDFEELRKYADKYINQAVKMGEGWLITAEMAALAESGIENIICTQPFGCLPNHIVAKGMSRVIKEAYPDANIVAIDYDPGATKVNQENRIKLMLANAKK